MRIERLHKIQELLENLESISINKLCETFQVSPNTIRRDVAELEQRGNIKKIYGGITLSDMPESSAWRETKRQNPKRGIARLASKLVCDNDVIYLDSGTTTVQLVPYLAAKKNVTMITASIYAISAAASYQQINVIATGGCVYRPSHAFVGTSVIDFLRNYNIAKTFFAANGFSIETGVTHPSSFECNIKQYLMENSQKKILLADSSKAGRTSLMTFCQLKDMDYFITDQKPPQRYLSYLEKHHVQLITNDDKALT